MLANLELGDQVYLDSGVVDVPRPAIDPLPAIAAKDPSTLSFRLCDCIQSSGTPAVRIPLDVFTDLQFVNT